MKSVHRQISTHIECEVWSDIPNKQMRNDVWDNTWNVVEDVDTHKILTILEVENIIRGK